MTNATSFRDRSTLTLPNDMGYLPVALGFVRSMAGHLGFSEADQRSIELVVEEAVTNVIEHAFGENEDASFDIACRKVTSGIEICIRDQGVPWDPRLDEEYHPEADLENQTGKGLGKYLIQHLVDEYAFENLGHAGKQMRLIKYFDTPHITESRERLRGAEQAVPLPAKAEPVDLEIRRMQPEEAIEVSRAVFDAYGYSYAGDFVYYPERIAAMNVNGEMVSAVAVIRETGEIAGHNALIFSDRHPAELAVAVTKHQFRGLGIARRLGEFLTQQALEMDLSGLYVKEVTVHPYTQKFCRKLGFRDCGFLLAHSPKSLAFKGIADDVRQRNSDLLGFQPIREPGRRRLYLPERHAGVIETIYAGLSIPMGWQVSSDVPGSDRQTVMQVAINSARSLCEIHITHYGADMVWVLRQELRRLRQHEVQLVEMFLNLTDTFTPWAVAEAEKLGFFFTGILPEARDGDVIIMQFFNGIAVEYDQLVIDRPETAALLDYVKSLDPTMV